jgi:predicted transcriptional regulator
MSKDIKKLLDRITGKEVNHIRVTATSPWDKSRVILRFNIEINKANLDEFEGHDYIVMYLMISNRTTNDEVDENEFEYQFEKQTLQEELKEMIYEKYKIELFGIDIDNLDLEYEYL